MAPQVSGQRDRLEARNAQLEAVERVQLREALAHVHRGAQGELDSGAAYLAAVQDLADSQVRMYDWYIAITLLPSFILSLYRTQSIHSDVMTLRRPSRCLTRSLSAKPNT